MAKHEVDWPLVEIDWRAGIKSKKQMAEEHGVSRAAMDKHFAKLGIDRDLAVQIRARSEALVAQQLVADRLHVTEDLIIEANANLQVAARNKHRELAERKLELNDSLLTELELQTASPEDLAKLGELMSAPDERGVDKLNELYHKIISTPGRIDSFKKLAEANKVVVALHRQAVGLADNANGDSDAPKDAPLAPNDAARRIAFVLQQAVKGK